MITKDNVLYWHELGFQMRRLVKNGKVPAFKGSFDTGDTLQDLLGWIKQGGNLGVLTGQQSGVVCLDIDVHNGDDGLQNLKDYMFAHDTKLPSTRTIKSPTGGLHMYYKLPKGYETRRFKPNHEAIEALDFRNHSQFMVLEGSSRKVVDKEETQFYMGKTNVVKTYKIADYELIKDIDFRDIPDCPSWVLELYVKEDVQETSNSGKMTYIAKKLSEWSQPVTSGNRNNYMTSIVGFMILQNLPIEQVYMWSNIINVNFVRPSLDADEMNLIINSVMKRELLKRNK